MVYFYSIELTFRLIYTIFSFFLCSLISLLKIHPLLILLTYPFLNIFHKKFIVTNVTDFFDVAWVLVCSTSALIVLPFFIYHLRSFIFSAWYNYQMVIFNKICCWTCFASIISLVFCYSIVIPTTLNFLIYWNKIDKANSILLIEIEFKILNFINWILSFQHIFTFFILLCTFTFFLLWFLFQVEKMYFIVKLYRKQFSFLNLLIFFAVFPPDIFLQLFLIFSTIFFYECVFFSICYKTSNSKN